jgi:hypothetical protein
MRGEVVAKNPDKPPVAVFYPKAAWLDAFVDGATITGRAGKGVLIPINAKSASGRIGYRAFQRMIQALAAQGNLEFRPIKGHVIVFAEVGAALERSADGRRINRLSRTNIKNRAGKRKSEVAIAIWVPRVVLGKRLDFESKSRLIAEQMADAIQAELGR